MPRSKKQFEEMRSKTREAIISAALKLFTSRGWGGTSVDEIAQACGISNGLIYHYFDSKEALYSQLMESAVSFSLETLRLVEGAPAPPDKKIETLSRVMLDIISENDDASLYFALMVQGGMSDSIPESAKTPLMRTGIPIEVISRVIAQGQKFGTIEQGDPVKLAILYWSAIEGLCLLKLSMGIYFQVPTPEMLDKLLLTSRNKSKHISFNI